MALQVQTQAKKVSVAETVYAFQLQQKQDQIEKQNRKVRKHFKMGVKNEKAYCLSQTSFKTFATASRCSIVGLTFWELIENSISSRLLTSPSWTISQSLSCHQDWCTTKTKFQFKTLHN